ncbi:MauE/DoxX family redox-associated membrane protein [Mucilaginibacter ginkgonis]|uniref:Methylamine utilisation protein MauE domain-containing protein n=1 Tax=Mucilaginibacter ginkgonis TaxID=2682091 RepID=A0A6I4IMQ4_9SPHI|nr:MauE/DoxX family redox-associated membrane protein [Mucilaginibacter ginkgonis]QQL49889.1 hypothetical protein GO620_000110 [Mucilaginibacter ginkgonis]
MNTYKQNISAQKWTDGISFLLILLFMYTASSKLLNFSQFSVQMHLQPFNEGFIQVLLYAIPFAEIGVSILLLFRPISLIGFLLAFILMALFTGYVGLVLLHFYDKVPCACGGALKSLGWKWHFILNLFFLLLTGIGLYITVRERRKSRQ